MKYIYKKLRMILFHPTKFFNSVKKEDMGSSLAYIAILGILPIIIMLILGLALFYGASSYVAILAIFTPIFMATYMITFYVTLIIGSILGAAILHIFAYALGARKGFRNTYKACAYGMTPTIIFAWVALLGVAFWPLSLLATLFTIWSWYLEVKGLSVLHKMTMWRAFLATLIPILILLVVAMIAVLIFMPFTTVVSY